MRRFNQLRLLVLSSVVMVMALAATVWAQDNPIPHFWRQLHVQVIETYGNNNTKPLQGAKVTIELKYPEKAEEILQKYPTIQLPATRTSQTTGARFGKLPPSKDVGPYIVTVIPKPNDINKEYICEEKTNRDSREVRIGSGGAPQRLTFNYTCKKADTVNEFDRRSKGGYDLTVKIEENGGTRGNGLWVHVYDKNGNRVKKVRTGGTATAVFRAIDPAYGPYKIEVYKINKLVHTSQYDMPNQNSTYTVDLNAAGGGGSSRGYDLTVKLDPWVHVYDKNGKLVKKERLNGGKAKFRNLKSDYNPYKIEVYSSNKLLYTGTYEMPGKNATYEVKK